MFSRIWSGYVYIYMYMRIIPISSPPRSICYMMHFFNDRNSQQVAGSDPFNVSMIEVLSRFSRLVVSINLESSSRLCQHSILPNYRYDNQQYSWKPPPRLPTTIQQTLGFLQFIRYHTLLARLLCTPFVLADCVAFLRQLKKQMEVMRQDSEDLVGRMRYYWNVEIASFNATPNRVQITVSIYIYILYLQILNDLGPGNHTVDGSEIRRSPPGMVVKPCR